MNTTSFLQHCPSWLRSNSPKDTIFSLVLKVCKFVKDSSDCIRRFCFFFKNKNKKPFSLPALSQNQTQIISMNRDVPLFFFFFFKMLFLSEKEAPHVYVRAWTLCCSESLISTQRFRRALTASVDSCAEMKSAPSAA